MKTHRSNFRLSGVSVVLIALFALLCQGKSTRWIDVPFVRQVQTGCGPAAIAMVMQYWVKHKLSLNAAAASAEHIDEALPSSSKGISGKELKRYLEVSGFSAYVFNAEIRDLDHHLAKGRPVVVCLGLKGPDTPLHYAVVVGVGEDEILLNDPARGKLIREEKETFVRAWKITENWALLAVPRQTP